MKAAFTPVVKASLQGRAFENPYQSQSDPLELRIASELWRWAFSDDVTRDELTSRREFAGDLEYYLCGVLDIIPQAQARDLWCDGVVNVEITRLNRSAFRIIGIAYLTRSNASRLAVFELEFYFEQQCDVVPSQVIFRIHPDVNPNASRRSSRAEKLLANRPLKNRDWAIAVTITPKVD